jgi:hypothetical protein
MGSLGSLLPPINITPAHKHNSLLFPAICIFIWAVGGYLVKLCTRILTILGGGVLQCACGARQRRTDIRCRVASDILAAVSYDTGLDGEEAVAEQGLGPHALQKTPSEAPAWPRAQKMRGLW